MGILSQYEPRTVLEYFELLSSVPHGSGNTRAISDICVGFAEKHGFEYYRDGLNNVIIIKKASAGYEDTEPVIMQGHLDMVCTKEAGCDIDMAKEPVRLAVDGDYIHAKGTSLGGDNAIAVAMILAVLDSVELQHPRIEAVFTVDEEVGMDGAVALDVSLLRGKKLLNLDSEEEGFFTVGCAGGARVDSEIPVTRGDVPHGFTCCKAVISGLRGGHSGMDIDKGRGSSNQLMGRFLYSLSEKSDIRLVSMDGGMFDNVIPLLTTAEFVLPATEYELAQIAAREYADIYKNEFCSADPDVMLTLEKSGGGTLPISRGETVDILKTLLILPYGVEAMSADFANLVETSLNMGIIHLDADAMRFSYSVRSSVLSRKLMLIQRIEAAVRAFGGKVIVRSSYPGWQYKKDSPLRDTLSAVYRELTGKDAVITATHGGLECGLFIEKIPGLDCVSCGPNLYDVHSVRERMSISSVGRVWEMVCETLKRCR